MDCSRLFWSRSLGEKVAEFAIVRRVYSYRSQVYDIYIVPISISYDRLLESSLYAYELQGRRKPAESTSGLLKAAAILRDNYGTVSVTVAEPISVREYFSRWAELFASIDL